MLRSTGFIIFAAISLAGAARADDTIDTLRQPVIDYCKSTMGTDAPPKGADAACICMIDGIIADFGADALPMLRILNAHLDPSQIKEIAALLGLDEKATRAFVEMAEPRIETIQTRCMQ